MLGWFTEENVPEIPVTEIYLLFTNHILNFDILVVKVGAVVVVVGVVVVVVEMIVVVIGTVPMLLKTLNIRVVTRVVPKMSRIEKPWFCATSDCLLVSSVQPVRGQII